MLKEAIDSIVNLACKASVAHVVQIPGDHRNAFLVLNGAKEPILLPPPRRNHFVYTAKDLVSAVKLATKPAIFHNDNQVVLLLDHEERMDRVTMMLEPAATYTTLASAHEQLYQPKDLARLLRVDLAGTGVPDELIRALRRLKWFKRDEHRQEFGHGRESIGRDVEAEISADVELPEEVTLETSVYENPGETMEYPIRCLLDPDPLQQKISFRPLPGELEEAMRLQQYRLRERLQADLPDVPIYHGVP